MTEQELRAQYPDLIAAVEEEAKASVDTTEAVSAAVKAERDRLAAIDEVASLFDPALVQESKYGENPCSAQEMTLIAAKNAAKQGQKFLANLEDDSKNSNTAEVGAAPGTNDEGEEETTPQAKYEKARAEVAALFGKNKKED